MENETQDNIVRDGGGEPVVPTGVEKPMTENPKDTLPRPAPESAMPLKEETPQSPEVTQETTSQEAVESTTTYDELVAKKGFKSKEDLAKAYVEKESQSSRVEATLAQAIEARTEPTPESEETPDIESVESNEDALKIVDSMIDKKLKAQSDAQDYQLYLLRNPNDQQFASEAIKVVRENPGVRWDVAFKAAKADSLAGQVDNAREEGKQEAFGLNQEKESAQTIHSSQRSDSGQLDAKGLIAGIKSGEVPLTEAKKRINELASNL